MTPAERPSGWVLCDREGRIAHKTIYPSLSSADGVAERWTKRGVARVPEPVWTRDEWIREMARRADA